MTTPRTTERGAAAGRLLDVMSSVPPQQAAIASVVTEAFIRGMVAQQMLTGNVSAQSEKKGA